MAILKFTTASLNISPRSKKYDYNKTNRDIIIFVKIIFEVGNVPLKIPL